MSVGIWLSRDNLDVRGALRLICRTKYSFDKCLSSIEGVKQRVLIFSTSLT